MSKLPVRLLATGALVLGIAACGSSSSSTTAHTSAAAAPASTTAAPASTATTAAAAPAASTVAISAQSSGQLMFSADALTAKAGTVTIVFTNDAPEDHNFTLQQGTGGKVLGATPSFHGGSRTLVLHLTPGKYTYFCTEPGHRAAGMQGTLTVTA